MRSSKLSFMQTTEETTSKQENIRNGGFPSRFGQVISSNVSLQLGTVHHFCFRVMIFKNYVFVLAFQEIKHWHETLLLAQAFVFWPISRPCLACHLQSFKRKNAMNQIILSLKFLLQKSMFLGMSLGTKGCKNNMDFARL